MPTSPRQSRDSLDAGVEIPGADGIVTSYHGQLVLDQFTSGRFLKLGAIARNARPEGKEYILTSVSGPISSLSGGSQQVDGGTRTW